MGHVAANKSLCSSHQRYFLTKGGAMKKEKKAKIIVIAVISILVLCVVGTTVVTLVALKSPLVNSRLAQFRSDLGAMFDLQKQLASTYPAEGIEVKIHNGHFLVISLINPESIPVTDESREEKAKEIAKFTWENYAENLSIDGIQIIFIKQQNVLIVEMNQTYSYYFDTEALR